VSPAYFETLGIRFVPDAVSTRRTSAVRDVDRDQRRSGAPLLAG
jgi:hypothetical protein